MAWSHVRLLTTSSTRLLCIVGGWALLGSYMVDAVFTPSGMEKEARDQLHHLVHPRVRYLHYRFPWSDDLPHRTCVQHIGTGITPVYNLAQ